MQLFDALSPHIEEALSASIERFGVLVPVVKDQHGRTLDGHHRARIADELGVKYRVDVVQVRDEEEAREIARHLNSRRRHLSGDQLKEHIIMLAERTTPSGIGQLSQNEIAQVAGVAQSYVNKVLSDPQVITSDNLPDSRRGADGKVYPAKRPARNAEYPVWGSPEARTADVIRCWAEEPHIASRETFEDVGGCPYCLHTPEERQAALKARDALTRRMRPTIVAAKDEQEAERAQQALASFAEPADLGTLTANEAIRAAARQRVPEAVPEPIRPPDGKFSCIVIDPPWPMQKIEREERPNQGRELDYPVMSLEQIADENLVPVRTLAADDAHIYLWVTHKFLPAGMDLLEAWGFRYQCVMTWRKNVGITPFSWMYDTEHVLFGRRGNLKLQRLGLRLSFEAPVRGHSAKPDVFYERVIEASPGPRVEMFSRSPREGFTVWGNEVANVV